MAHDVFISYSSKDKAVADAACATLEARGIRCWIAPRDVLPGEEWGGSLVEAIGASRAMVLIFSANANRSPQIKREVNHAVEKGVAVVPLRIEDVSPSETMEYYLDVTHWLDALTPPLEGHLQGLADKVGVLLNQSAGGAADALAGTPVSRVLADDGASRRAAPRVERKYLLVGGACVALALLMGLYWWWGSRSALDLDKDFQGVMTGYVNRAPVEVPVTMTLRRSRDGRLRGRYRYRTSLASGFLNLEGRMLNQREFRLDVRGVEPKEVFEGSFVSEDEIKGTWRRGDREPWEFRMTTQAP